MKFKLVPTPPDSVDAVADAHGALPLVPGSEEDCCGRVGSRLEVDRKQARTWVTFLRALDLARKTDSGFVRVRRDIDQESVAGAFREHVFGAAEILQILADADESLDEEAVFDAFRDVVPTWEHHKNPGTWETVWGDRVADLLDWAVLFGLAERVDGGYRSATE